MKKGNNIVGLLFAATGMFVLITDSQYAAEGALQGLKICFETIIPSIFPLLILSSIVRQYASQLSMRRLSLIEKLCHIPKGAGYLFLIGITGGYPVAAICLEEVCSCGCMDQKDAARMLGFCNNCGPAFIFGMMTGAFEQWYIPWCLWAIQIVSAMLTGVLLPHRLPSQAVSKQSEKRNMTQLLHGAIKAMATICGWIILFRIVIVFAQRWLLWLLPVWTQVLISGLLELANGCIQLTQIQCAGLRFVLASALLSAGGFCVAMQTVSAVKSFSCKQYFSGKLIQTVISVLISCVIATALYNHQIIPLCLLLGILSVISIVKHISRKNRTGNPAIHAV